MNQKIKILWGVFLCLLCFQASIILSYAHSQDKATIITARQETSTEVPAVQMGEIIDPKDAAAESLPWGDLNLLKLRNDFEKKLLPNLEGKAKKGIIAKGTMQRYIQNHFLKGGLVSQEDAKKVARMINVRIRWLRRFVSDELRSVHSTTKKYAHVAHNPYRTRPYSKFPIPGGKSGQWGPVSDYEAQRAYLRLMGVSDE